VGALPTDTKTISTKRRIVTASALGTVPHSAECLVVDAEGHQRPCEVLDVGDRVRGVGVAENAGGFACESSGKHPVADR
jgi:hypothetical protein